MVGPCIKQCKKKTALYRDNNFIHTCNQFNIRVGNRLCITPFSCVSNLDLCILFNIQSGILTVPRVQSPLSLDSSSVKKHDVSGSDSKSQKSENDKLRGKKLQTKSDTGYTCKSRESSVNTSKELKRSFTLFNVETKLKVCVCVCEWKGGGWVGVKRTKIPIPPRLAPPPQVPPPMPI